MKRHTLTLLAALLLAPLMQLNDLGSAADRHSRATLTRANANSAA